MTIAEQHIETPPEGQSLVHQAEALEGELEKFNRKSSTGKMQDAPRIVGLAVAVLKRQAVALDAITRHLEGRSNGE